MLEPRAIFSGAKVKMHAMNKTPKATLRSVLTPQRGKDRYWIPVEGCKDGPSLKVLDRFEVRQRT